MTVKLKPCPFCGKAMMLRGALWPSEGDTDAIIHGEPTDCPMYDFCDGTSDGSIVDRWNSRPAPAAADMGLETVGVQYAHEHSITGRAMWGWQKEWKGCAAIGTRELVTRSQAESEIRKVRKDAEELLAAKDETIRRQDIALRGALLEVERLKTDNAARDSRIKELDGECNELVAKCNEIIGQRDHALNTCAQMEEDKDALEANLAAANELVVRAQVIIPDHYVNWHQDARAVLGGKPL